MARPRSVSSQVRDNIADIPAFYSAGDLVVSH